MQPFKSIHCTCRLQNNYFRRYEELLFYACIQSFVKLAEVGVTSYFVIKLYHVICYFLSN